MDWTGGTRKRYVKGKQDAVYARQKAHFAKMAKIHAARAVSGSTPSFAWAAPDSRHFRADMISACAPRPESTHDLHRASQSTHRGGQFHRAGRCAHGLQQQHDFKGVASSSRRPDKKMTWLPPLAAGHLVEGDSLHARKQRLLARRDWLGLAAARPLRLKFNQNRDRDRIAKRRKIDKPSRDTTQKRHKRILTPLVQDQFKPHQALMSGALPNDDICIKVGTDALTAQTQASHRSRTPIATSIRPISVASEPLSEESMLLGVDEHGFDTGGARASDSNFTQHTTEQRSGRARSSRICAEKQLPWAPEQEVTFVRHSWLSPAQHHSEPSSDSDGRGALGQERLGYEHDDNNLPQKWLDDAAGKTPASEAAQMYVQDVRDASQHMTSPLMVQPVDKRSWQHAWGVSKAPATQASVIVLRSSSAHDSDCTTTHWRPLESSQLENKPIEPDANHTAAGGDDLHAESVPPNTGSSVSLTLYLQPDNRSVSAHTQTSARGRNLPATEQPSKCPEGGPGQSTDDEALWKQFIVGSSSSGSESGYGLGRALFQDDFETDPLSPAPPPTSRSTSSEPLSDRATVANSTHLRPNSVMADLQREPAITPPSLYRHTATSETDHATPDDEPSKPARASRHANIHPSAVSAPRRQKFNPTPRRAVVRGVPSSTARLFTSAPSTSPSATAGAQSSIASPRRE